MKRFFYVDDALAIPEEKITGHGPFDSSIIMCLMKKFRTVFLPVLLHRSCGDLLGGHRLLWRFSHTRRYLIRSQSPCLAYGGVRRGSP